MSKNNKEKKLRRELEILKAQLKTQKQPISQPNVEPVKQNGNMKISLPINQIKKDLLKTVLFAGLSVTVLTALKIFKVGFPLL